MRVLIRRARLRQQEVVELLTEEATRPLSFVGSVGLDDDVVEVSGRVREMLGVAVDEQITWPDPARALREWLDAIEETGVFIFQSSNVSAEEMRAFTLMDDLAPIITLNAKDVPAARIFSLFHEMAHILLGFEGTCDLDTPQVPRTEEQRTEVFCNGVAAETLVPAAHLRGALDSLGPNRDADEVIGAFSRRYKVSREVVARRLYDLGVISRAAYQGKRNKYATEYASRDDDDKKSGFAPPYRMAIRDNGRAFTRLVLSAHARDSITARDVSALLGVRLKHLPRIEREVFSSSAERIAR
jgi:Zn-dependent peptidase ImmA (M78 family)